MPEPVLIPPTPSVNASDSPEQIAHTIENVQKIFDRVTPKIRGTPTPESPPEQPAQTPAEPVAPTAEKPTEPTKPQAETTDTPADHKIPSFIEKALEVPEVKSDAPTTIDEDWPEELPTFKNSDEAKSRYKNWREKYNANKKEIEQLRSRPAVDETLNQKLAFLENANKEKDAILTRMGVENHVEFQNKILRPLQQAWTNAATIVRDAGGDPEQLAKALQMTGKSHFEALDSVFEGMPESAKVEANQAISEWRRLEGQRRQALLDAPKTAKALKQADLERQYATIQKQKSEMVSMFDDAVKTLRDEAKVEVLQRNDDPDAKWWNEQADQIEQTSRNLFLENTDMKKVAMACVLAPMADTYRKLWLAERASRGKEQKIIRERFGAEPNLSESGGNFVNGTSQAEDLKLPFDKVFLREFHKARQAGVR